MATLLDPFALRAPPVLFGVSQGSALRLSPWVLTSCPTGHSQTALGIGSNKTKMWLQALCPETVVRDGAGVQRLCG